MGIGRVLVIAGSDSSGGAGLEADQKVIAAHECYAMTATTALTAQNTRGVEDIHHIPAEFVGKLIDVTIGDMGVDVVKTASAETVEVVAKALKRHHVKTLIVDPVMISTSGTQLLPSIAIRHLRELLLPYTTVLTPNVPEAKLLLSDAGKFVEEPKNLDDLKNIAKEVQSLGPRYVLVKGGHLPLRKDGTVATKEEEKELMVDILYGEGVITEIRTKYQNSRNTHGTGCSMASAIASNIAKGIPLVQAVRSACWGHFIEYLLERPDVTGAWRDHTEHAFVAGIGDGTLPMESFKYYLIQDYLYLVPSYKAKTMEGIAASAGIVLHIHREMALHINYCEGFGMTKAEIEACEESQELTIWAALLEKYAVLQSPNRIEELVKIFIHATKDFGTWVAVEEEYGG
ncbi:hypothetical protein SS1G_00072 [Sclerotinia sclerotiorum 1980 UF-70]|uniref:Pyridoxamine kinase/Phosphomethylpyrimidine kinase domain-containing protein n=1 Tax=Sclerotinia sclerotiorum (strain ATCC 18683 / 1980 / Ss-1) TaxID=665079 RepID=A7E450_SCLS1|nr:hypothetical protein SS1G_00072 [Sclerotinia sclerotiorum 1980 UF-70]EDN90672.1 hypothetical protein SS1G_00072 [Sclerotinia sclerotiorum 1980 UF-70]